MTINAPQLAEGTPILNLGEPAPDAQKGEAFVAKATDPNIAPTPYASPADYSAVYPINLIGNTEIMAMCEEISTIQALPEVVSDLKAETWRELNSLAFTSGSAYISFADGDCPNEFTANGANTTISLKHLGAKKTISESDLLHSRAMAQQSMGSISTMTGPMAAGSGMPGGSDATSFQRQQIADIKAREALKAAVLVANGYDNLLVKGNATTNSLEFDGLETQITAANGAHNNATSPSGTFAAATYDRFLAASCAKPTHIFGHPQAVQEMLSGYFQLGFAGSQVVQFDNNNRITPGLNYAGFVNTGIGRKPVVADVNFTRNDAGSGTFNSNLYGIRQSHNGDDLVYRRTQIPMQLKDLVPGCTAISFQVYCTSALIVKHKCAHSVFSAKFTGNITTTCPRVGNL